MSSESKYALITGAAILTLAGLISRVTGFFYRIFLSHSIGAEGMGIYQMIFPVYGFCFALVVSGMQTAISRSCAASWAAGRPRQAKTSFLAGFSLSLGLSLVIAFLLHGQAGRLAKLLSMDSRCIPLLQLIAFGIPFGVVHTCISAYYYARNKTAVPAAAQLLEQFTRVGASLVIWQIFLAEGKSPLPGSGRGRTSGRGTGRVAFFRHLYSGTFSGSLPSPGTLRLFLAQSKGTDGSGPASCRQPGTADAFAERGSHPDSRPPGAFRHDFR